MRRPAQKINLLSASESWPRLHWEPHSISSSPVNADLRQSITTDLVANYYNSVSPTVLNTLLVTCKDWSTKTSSEFYDKLQDVLIGAGSVINPLPHDTEQFFVSDLEALQSDWTVACSDLESIWNTTAEIHDWLQEHVSNEPTAKWEQAANERRQPAESTVADSGDYSAGS